MDRVDLPVVDIEGSLGDLLLPGIKSLQIPLVVPNKPAATHTKAHRRHSCIKMPSLASSHIQVGWWLSGVVAQQQHSKCATSLLQKVAPLGQGRV